MLCIFVLFTLSLIIVTFIFMAYGISSFVIEYMAEMHLAILVYFNVSIYHHCSVIVIALKTVHPYVLLCCGQCSPHVPCNFCDCLPSFVMHIINRVPTFSDNKFP